MLPRDPSAALTIFLLLNGAHQISCEALTDTAARKLREHLLKGYDNSIRPVSDHGKTTVVKIFLAPVHIAEMDEKQGTLKMDATAHMWWEDEHLKWNPQEFSGITKVHFQGAEIWKPDLKIFNGRSFLTTPWMYGGLSVNSSGHVTWLPSALMYSICSAFDYNKYPDDIQTCKLLLGSWTANQLAIDFQLDSSKFGATNDWKMYYFNRSNPHWEVIGFEEQKLTYKDPRNDSQSLLKYEMKLKRINVPHMALGTVPDTVARVLLLCMFWLPDLNKKLMAGLTSIFVLTLIAVSINGLLPTPAAAPAALAEITAALAMGVAAIILEIFLSTLSGWTGDFPPFLNSLTSLRVFQALSSCAQKEHAFDTGSKNEPKPIGQADDVVRVRPWTVFALIVEKILFVFFCVLLLAV